nr:hypothetical protein [Tanacetum cinerariifolium]
VLYDRVMYPLTTHQERKTRKDYGTRSGRSSTSSSSAFGQPSSSHLNDDDNNRNNEGTSRTFKSTITSSHPFLDITPSLSPITPIDHILDTPLPPLPQPPPQPPLSGDGNWKSSRSMEDQTQLIFVTNFPDHVTAHDLWKVCNDFGGVVDAFIPYKKSKEAPMEDQPLPDDASPTALSSGFIANSDLEEDSEENPQKDPTDYPTDGGDDDDNESPDYDDNDDDDDDEYEAFENDDNEEEHLALAKSSAVPVDDPVPSAEDKEAFETNKSTPKPAPSLRRRTTRISIPSPPLPLPSPPTTSPTYAEAPMGYRAARIQLRTTSPPTHHPSEIPSPPLLLPSTSYRDDFLEADMPLWKRAGFTNLTGRFEVRESSAAAAARQHGLDVTTVIEFRNSYVAPKNGAATDSASKRTATKKGRTVASTIEDMQKRRNDVKARTTLLLDLLDEHQLRFNKYKTAQELWAAILKTFGGNEATRKTKKNLLKQQYGNFKAEGLETLEQTFNRLHVIVSQLEFMDIEIEQDDLNQNSENEEVNTASIPTACTQVSPTGPNVATASISLDTACAYIASQSNGSQIKYEDINQIDEDDIEEMDIKWNMALLSMRADRFWKKTGKKISIQGTDVDGFDKSKVECFNCHKMGHFARECRAPRSQDRGRRDNYRQGFKVEEKAPKALMAIDEVGWD